MLNEKANGPSLRLRVFKNTSPWAVEGRCLGRSTPRRRAPLLPGVSTALAPHVKKHWLGQRWPRRPVRGGERGAAGPSGRPQTPGVAGPRPGRRPREGSSAAGSRHVSADAIGQPSRCFSALPRSLSW